MRIYSNHIDRAHVISAARQARAAGADIRIDDMHTFQPRSPRYASGIEFWAYSDNGRAASGHRPIGSYPLGGVVRAASWSDYGYVIAYLFNTDPHARIGDYHGEADFVAKVRQWPRRGASLDFLNVLTSIGRYPDPDAA